MLVGRRIASRTSCMARRASAAMRILPVRTDHVGSCVARKDAETQRRRNRSSHGRKPVPLRNVSTDQQSYSSGRERKINMTLNRRAFIATSTVAGTGLVIGFQLSGPLLFAQENEHAKKKPMPNPFVAWVHVKPTGEISLIIAKSEMGQGIRTDLAIPLADEAEVDLNHVTVEQAETRPDIY